MASVRRLHRLLGLFLVLPLLAWTGTGLLFFVKPGWAAAYETLRAFDAEALNPGELLSPAELPIAAGEATAWELRSTALGPLYLVSRTSGREPLLVHARTGAILSPLDRAAVEEIAQHASARSSAPSRYGDIEEVVVGERVGTVRFAGGARVRVDRYDLGLSQSGRDTVWIDRLYDVHYLRWTGVEVLDRILSPIAILGVWLLAFTGLRMLFRRSGARSPATALALPSSGAQLSEVRRGDVHWLAPEHGGGSRPHPHVVVQDDVFNRSRLPTIVLCALTSNLHRADEPGNVLLDEGEGGLPKRSVVVVSQLVSVEKSALGERIGSLSNERVEQIVAGLRFQQRSYFERSS